MGTLLLNSLEIRNFRGFHHLQIDHLGRVNLIVGKNNIGKSSLLEALHLYTQRFSPTLVWEILRARDESKYSSGVLDESKYLLTSRSLDRPENFESQLLALKYLFYGRKTIRTHVEPIQIGPLNSQDETLSISIGWYAEEVDEQGRLKRRLLGPEGYSTVDNPFPRFTIQMGKQPKVDYPLNPYSSTYSRLIRPEFDEIDCFFVGADGLSGNQAGNLWDQTTLRSIDVDVLTSLCIIAPGVEGYSFVGDPESRTGLGRIPIVRIKDIDDPLPLRSLGNGMYRMLCISLSFVNATDGMLLIDEIENGIHYSVQPELWQLIFQLARRLNVQVFATTHSWDCIEGFQKAAQEDKQEDGMLIRLSLRKDEVVATLFDERKLGIATREQIEVR